MTRRIDYRVLGWEKAVLGTALSDPESMAETGELLPSDFSGCHQIIWAEMLSLHRRDALEMRALVEALRSSNQLDEIASFDAESVRGEDYLAELVTSRGSAMQEYAGRVVAASVKRQLLTVSALIRADAQDEHVDAHEALDEAERRVMNLRRTRSQDRGVSMADLLSLFTDRMQQFREGTLEPAWVPSTEAIARVVQFVDRDDFIIIAARPGEGKSSLMRAEFIQAAMHGKPVLLFNLENGELEYAKFALAWYTGIDSDKLKNPRLLTDEDLHRIREAADQLARMPLYIKTLGGPSAREIDRIARQHIAQQKVELVGVDYIQLMMNGQATQNQNQNVSISSSTLRAIALRHGVPVLANSQMSRSIVHRGDDAKPKLSDLRDSGSLEQDATMVWFPWPVWRDPGPGQLRMFPQNIDPNGRLYETIKALPVRFIVAKNRNGGTGTSAPVLWERHTNRYLPLQNIEDLIEANS